MVQSYPSLSILEQKMPEYISHWKKSVDHAENVFETLINKQMSHTEYPYQQVRDAWQMVLDRWDEMACAPAAVNLQEEIAAGARIQKLYCQQRLETLRNYDYSPYRTVWMGTGQPRDPYDSYSPSMV